MSFTDRIVTDPHVCGRQPVIKGTRVLVRTIFAYLAQEQTFANILAEFPSLTEGDIQAVVAFAATSASEDLPGPSPIPPDIRAA